MKFKDFIFLTKKALKIDQENLSKKRADNVGDEVGQKLYRLVIIDEIKLKESFATMFTRRKIYFFVFVFFLLNCLTWYVIFAFTPVKFILPESGSYIEKKELVLLRKRVDSLEQQYRLNEAMINKFKSYFFVVPRNEEIKNINSERKLD